MFGPVPEDKSDFRMVAKAPVEGTPPVGLRVSKIVRGKDESLYTFLLPGLVPDPLKLSVHPWGEIQLKSKAAGLIARLDKARLIEGLKSGELDAAAAKLLTPRLARERAEGFIMRPDMFQPSTVVQGQPLRDQNVSIEELLESMTKIQLDDTSQLPQAITMLREDGLLPTNAILQLVNESSEKSIVFLSVGPPLPDGPPVSLPEGFPLRKTLLALVESLRKYGGLVFTMPDESDLKRMAEALGLGDLLGGIQRFAEALDHPDSEAKIMSAFEEILPGLAGPIRTIARAKPVRPLRAKRAPRVRRAAPPGGWVRRRPRRRGHTAPLTRTD
jgi:hypothetical protein